MASRVISKWFSGSEGTVNSWDRFAEQDPYLYILTSMKRTDPRVFWQSGEQTIKIELLPFVQSHDLRPLVALELGCGIGRLAFLSLVISAGSLEWTLRAPWCSEPPHSQTTTESRMLRLLRSQPRRPVGSNRRAFRKLRFHLFAAGVSAHFRVFNHRRLPARDPHLAAQARPRISAVRYAADQLRLPSENPPARFPAPKILSEGHPSHSPFA